MPEPLTVPARNARRALHRPFVALKLFDVARITVDLPDLPRNVGGCEQACLARQNGRSGLALTTTGMEVGCFHWFPNCSTTAKGGA